jgi:thiol-disulfide isomerase/thioredoxin
MRALLTVSILLALAACNRHQPQPSNRPAPASEPGQVKGVDRSHKGKPLPDIKVLDPAGKQTSVRSLQHGRFMLVNLWASWCAPCVKELPTLQKLRDARGPDLTVLPIDQDMGPQASVEAFLKEHRLDFAPYQDPNMSLSGALGAEVLPTTILYDSSGKEVWRYVGDLDWTSAEAAKLLAEGGVRQSG